MWVRGLKLNVSIRIRHLGSRTLCGCVDWNQSSKTGSPVFVSHPMWVRGLKQHGDGIICRIIFESHPMWVRGLKPKYVIDKYFPRVAPYVGAWIETRAARMSVKLATSHPMWVRGLKPRYGPWWSEGCHVAPYVGAWIETASAMPIILRWGRRTLCGCVDWNFYIIYIFYIIICRTLCGCVDWNWSSCPKNIKGRRSHPMWVRGLKQFFVLTVQSYKPKPRNIVLASNIPI